MHLLDLPNEVLQRIAVSLDIDSLIAFATTNSRLAQVSLNSLRTLRLKRIVPPLSECLNANGSSIRSLDLSSCCSGSEELESVIKQCRNITELNVINSRFHNLDILCDLEELESFSVTASCTLNSEFEKSYRFASIRKVYIDSIPRQQELIFTMDFLNSCTSIEVIHVNIFGVTMGTLFSELPNLIAERWNTLHTVICTRLFTRANVRVRMLLKHIFANKTDPGIEEWIARVREYYIYEHGHLSGRAPREDMGIDKVSLLRQYHSVDLPPDGDITEIFKSPWGSPRAVRVYSINCSLSRFENCWSTALVELNLRGCHNSFASRFILDLVASVPTLEDIASSLCFFLPESLVDRDIMSLHKEELCKALQKLTLKKFFLEGFFFIREYTSSCSRCRTSLTSLNLVDMTKLEDLEELTLSGVDLEASAYSNMGTSKVRTVMLRLNAKNDYSGLRAFIRRCRDLRYLKLEGFDFQLHLLKVWEALVEGRELKQVCLSSGVGGFTDTVFSGEFQDYFLEIIRRLEFMHLHSPDSRFIKRLRMFLIESKHSYLCEKVYSEDTHFSLRNIRSARLAQGTVGRSLCYSESFAGLVPPLGWDID